MLFKYNHLNASSSPSSHIRSGCSGRILTPEALGMGEASYPREGVSSVQQNTRTPTPGGARPGPLCGATPPPVICRSFAPALAVCPLPRPRVHGRAAAGASLAGHLFLTLLPPHAMGEFPLLSVSDEL